jgi:hypothetical protein
MLNYITYMEFRMKHLFTFHFSYNLKQNITRWLSLSINQIINFNKINNITYFIEKIFL